MAKKETASPAIPVFPMLKTVEQMSKVSGIGENKLRELMKIRSKATLTLRAMLARRYGFGASPNKPPLCHLWPQRHCLPLSGSP